MKTATLEIAYTAISLLMAKPRNVAELMRLVECTRQTMNRHLKTMIECGLVRGYKEIGKPAVYEWVRR